MAIYGNLQVSGSLPTHVTGHSRGGIWGKMSVEHNSDDGIHIILEIKILFVCST